MWIERFNKEKGETLRIGDALQALELKLGDKEQALTAASNLQYEEVAPIIEQYLAGKLERMKNLPAYRTRQWCQEVADKLNSVSKSQRSDRQILWTFNRLKRLGVEHPDSPDSTVEEAVAFLLSLEKAELP